LNNPLGTILVYVQLLLARGNPDESTRECLQTIYQEAQRADAISTELLSFARRGKTEKRLISIQEVIQKSLELLIPRLRGSNIEVVVKLQPDMPKIMADPYQMQRVFTNIITNAEQAMTEAHGKGRLHIKAQVAGEIIRITFDDDGPGIKPKHLKNIFDPFFSTKEAGLGLGLSICCAIAEGHGGCIYAMNRPGQGATFAVELPIVA
jgi:signal transduction histidine kinase